MVVDNNSKDETSQTVEQYMVNNKAVNYITETNQGLSHARNKAIAVCDTTYLGYLDDDAIPHDNYVATLVNLIDKFEPDCFGGTYYPYYENEKPKWINEKFGSKKWLSDQFQLITSGYLSGGNMYCKLDLLKKVGGFDTDKGMKGNKMGYAEEDDLQLRLRNAGHSIFFDPTLAMDHLVASYKTKVTWHIKKAYHSGRNTVDVVYTKYDLKNTIIAMLKITFKQAPRRIKAFLFQKEYYKENLIIDIFSGYARVIGLYLNYNK